MKECVNCPPFIEQRIDLSPLTSGDKTTLTPLMEACQDSLDQAANLR